VATLDIAIIGCGAISEKAHLPAAAKIPSIRVTALVDANRARAEELAARYGIAQTAESFDALLDPPRAAIVALPHHCHASVATAVLARGVHVLVEKPMALSSVEGLQMARAAESGLASLTVAMVRRFLPDLRLARQVVASGVLGELRGFHVREGRIYDWPSRTDAPLRKESAGGGVLIDVGVHVLDSLLFCLGDLAIVDYADDCFGGVEAEAEIDLSLQSGVRGRVELSRLRDLGNTTRIEGSEAVLEIDLVRRKVIITVNDEAIVLSPSKEHGDSDIFRAQLADWSESILQKRPSLMSGLEALKSLALIEHCYARRRTLEQIWMTPSAFGLSEASVA
jgi:predicted dehydrogenase